MDHLLAHDSIFSHDIKRTVFSPKRAQVYGFSRRFERISLWLKVTDRDSWGLHGNKKEEEYPCTLIGFFVCSQLLLIWTDLHKKTQN